MRMRLGAPLTAILVGLLGAVQGASASHFGADCYDGCSRSRAATPSRASRPASSRCKTCYKLVWDNVMEKRWHTTYQTVQETVMKQVCKTCYRDECKTCYRTCTRPATAPSRSAASGRSPRPAGRTRVNRLQAVLQDLLQGGLRDGLPAGVRDLLQGVPLHDLQAGAGVLREGSLLHRLPAGAGSHLPQGLRPGLQADLRAALPRVLRDASATPVCETCYKEVCCDDVQAGLRDLHKQVCCTTYTNCVETCYKDVCKKVCKPVCTTKTVVEEVRRVV